MEQNPEPRSPTAPSWASGPGEAGDAAAARDIYAALLPVREKVLGAEHPHTLATRAELAYWTRQVNTNAEDRRQEHDESPR